MRRVEIQRGDFGLCHQDINPTDYEFFHNHSGAFKRMWKEQTKKFWEIFVDNFDHFIWNYGVMKDFPLKMDEVKTHTDDVIKYIKREFVDGSLSAAKSLVVDCVIVAQNKYLIGSLDKAPYAQNPFYMKSTRETFRNLFGPPKSKATIMKVLCGLPVYIKFAGAVVVVLRRWLVSEEFSDQELVEHYFVDLILLRHNNPLEVAKIKEMRAMKYSRGDKDMAEIWMRKLPFDEVTARIINDPNLASMTKKTEEKPIATLSKNTSDSSATETVQEVKKKRPKKKKKAETSVATDTAVVNGNSDDDNGIDGNNGEVPRPSPIQKHLSSSDKHVEEIVRNKENDDDSSSDHTHTSSDHTHSEPDQTQITPEDDSQCTQEKETPSKSDHEGGETTPTEMTGDDEGCGSKNKRLHFCSHCARQEELPKTFKRCVKCRGKPNPKYYCSKDCQVNDWKGGHKLDHGKDDD